MSIKDIDAEPDSIMAGMQSFKRLLDDLNREFQPRPAPAKSENKAEESK